MKGMERTGGSDGRVQVWEKTEGRSVGGHEERRVLKSNGTTSNQNNRLRTRRLGDMEQKERDN